jgi:predicted CopG family antitoxin
VSGAQHNENLSKADKRIPVTKERWEELHDLKGAGQTFDELLAELIEEKKEKKLAEMVREKREHGDFVEVDTDDW